MSEVMEPNVLRTHGFKNLLMSMPAGIGVEHPAHLGRWEHIRIFRGASCVPPACCLLGDGQDAYGVLCLGLAHCQFALDTVHLFRDGDGPVLHVQVCPEEGGEFTPPQARGQFQIERCQQAAFIRFHQIEFNFTFRQDFHSRF